MPRPYEHLSDAALENARRETLNALIRLDGTNDWAKIKDTRSTLKALRLEEETRQATQTIWVSAR